MSDAAALANANLCRHLADAAIHSPQALAVAVQKYQKNNLTYQEIDFATLHTLSDDIAFSLNAFGIKKGMKAVLMVTPSLNFFALTFALFKAGIVPILVDPGMGIKNLKQCFDESKPDAFIGIAKAHVARKLFGWGRKSVIFFINVSIDQGIDVQPKNRFSRALSNTFLAKNLDDILAESPRNRVFEMEKLKPTQMAAILFTSGSTGVPKGVVYSHQMFEAQITALKNDYEITPGERDLATFPLFSLFGPALGMASIVPDMDASKPITANPSYIFDAVEKYQCTNMFANPALLKVLGEAGTVNGDNVHQMPSLKRVISAGAPATLASIELFSKMLNDDIEILNSYGATESLPISKVGSKALLQTTKVTDGGGGICVGKPIEKVDIAIIDVSDDEIAQWHDELRLAPNVIGEIAVKGPMVSQQYYNREQATKLSKIASEPVVTSDVTKEGLAWHRMGDLGYLDENGQLWMCGRKSHRVSAPAKEFYSIPCERIFNVHPDVNRTALVPFDIEGVTHPLLCIELNKGASCKEQEVVAALKAIGSKFSQTYDIEHFIFHSDFPVDIRHNAKIFREKLAVWAQKHQRKVYS